MRKLFKILFILIAIAAVTAGVYAWVRSSKDGD